MTENFFKTRALQEHILSLTLNCSGLRSMVHCVRMLRLERA